MNLRVCKENLYLKFVFFNHFASTAIAASWRRITYAAAFVMTSALWKVIRRLPMLPLLLWFLLREGRLPTLLMRLGFSDGVGE